MKSWESATAQILIAVCAALLSLGPTVARADKIATFTFAPVGNSFSAFLSSADPLVGLEIVSARIYLDVQTSGHSNAANFFTDITFPINPFPGNENSLVLTGADLGWSGSGTFHHFEETTQFNGVFVGARYGGETSGDDFDGTILQGSRIEFDYIPTPIPEPGAIALIVIGTAGLVARRAIRKRMERVS